VIRLNLLIRAQRRRTALVLAVLGLAGATLAAHGALGQDHMGMSMDPIVVCLAVVATAAAALVVARAPSRWRWRFEALTPAPLARVTVVPVVPRTRDGPALLQVFRR
jgi:hypothetical protein